MQLSKECIDHLSQSVDSKKEKYAFAVKTRSLSLLLENYMEDSVKEITFKYFKELEEDIAKVKQRTDLNEETKKNHINNLRFEYMLPVLDQNIRLMQNSPIVEVEAHGIIDMNDKNIKKRISGKKHALPIRDRKGLEPDTDAEVVRVEDTVEEGESAFSFSNK